MKKINLSSAILTGNFSLFFLFILLSLTGCMQYQYLTIDSELQKKENTFIEENEMYKIIYEFSDYNIPVKLKIFNKLDVPLYIDWKKSSVVIDNESISYFDNNVYINGTASSYSNDNELLDHSVSTFEGSAKKAEMISYIPPQTYKSFHPINLRQETFNLKHLSNIKTKIKTKNTWVDAKAYSFTNEDSPFQYKSILVLSETEDFAKPVYSENNFWLKELYESYTRPKELAYPERFQSYVSRPTHVATVFVTTGVITGLIVAAALAPEEEL